MTRPDLEGLPEFALPADFRIDPYAPGAERDWLAIHHRSDRYNTFTEETFAHQFGEDEATLRQRQFYLRAPGGARIGTATAWFDHDSPLGDGQVHWVAILPEWQGRGLAKPLLSRVCTRLRDLGHRRAFLKTASARIPAIRLYIKFGFAGHPRNEEERQFWVDFRGLT